eukprot:TRINITY_DN4943_c0_g2_i10.p1 TRINITY_DN4943_c0_g2~~TRINITY_DN4943_c0_g2_i10.p1  ORF type:complete len:1199 (-),score=226.39 TRINITY_DN4943_c0_g2_i10:623-4219(-)
MASPHCEQKEILDAFATDLLGHALDEYEGQMFDVEVMSEADEDVACKDETESISWPTFSSVEVNLSELGDRLEIDSSLFDQASEDASDFEGRVDGGEVPAFRGECEHHAYEDVVSLASDDSTDEQDEELQALYFTSVAMKYARDAIKTSILSREAEYEDEAIVDDDGNSEDERIHVQDLLQASADGRLAEASDAETKRAIACEDEVHRQFSGIQENTRMHVQNLLVQASADGRFVHALNDIDEEVYTPQVDISNGLFMEEVRNFLVEASANGRLEDALSHIKTQLPSESEDNKHGHVADIPESLRTRAQNLLFQASSNGSLYDALRRTASLDHPQHGGGISEDLLLQTQNLLIGASADGRLADALKSAFTETSYHHGGEIPEDLRLQTRNLVMGASVDGRLVDALNSTFTGTKYQHGGDIPEGLRLQTRNILMGASVDGSLVDALKSTFTETRYQNGGDIPEDLLLHTQNLLMGASVDGRLAEALRCTVAKSSSMSEDGDHQNADDISEQLQMRVQDHLIQASIDGRLVQCLSSVDVKEDTGSLGCEHQGSVSIPDVLRLRVQHFLAQASRTGRLFDALHDAEIETVNEASCHHHHHHHQMEGIPEDLRLRVQGLLIQASADGSLAEALGSDGTRQPLGSTGSEQFCVEGIPEDLQLRVQGLLIQASADGSLADTLGADETRPLLGNTCSEHSQSGVIQERLRVCVQDLLFQASADGRLIHALRGLETGAATRGEGEKLQEKGDIEASIHMRVQDLLIEASADGRLVEALESTVAASSEGHAAEMSEEEESVEALRREARDMMLEANVSGRLRSVLRDVVIQSNLSQDGQPVDSASFDNPSLPAAEELSSCDRRSFEPRFCPSDEVPVAAEPFPMDCLPSTPLLVEPPPVEVSWSALLQVQRSATQQQVVPLDFTNTLCKTEEPAVAVTDVGEDSPPPSPSISARKKTHRRVIGAVVRDPTPQDHQFDGHAWNLASPSSMRGFEKKMSQQLEPLASPPLSPKSRGTSRGGSTSKRTKKSQARLVPTYEMNVEEPTVERDSSLSRGYDALGSVEIYSMNDMDDTPSQPLAASIRAPVPQKNQRSTFVGSMHMQPTSALMMDLGADASKGSSWTTQTTCRQSASALGRSSSLSALKVSKAFRGSSSKDGGLPSMGNSKSTSLLPSLSSNTTHSVEAISGALAFSPGGLRHGRRGISSNIF